MEAGWPYATFGLRLLASNTRPAPPSLALLRASLKSDSFQSMPYFVSRVVLATCYHCCPQALVLRTCASFYHGSFKVMDPGGIQRHASTVGLLCVGAAASRRSRGFSTMLDNDFSFLSFALVLM